MEVGKFVRMKEENGDKLFCIFFAFNKFNSYDIVSNKLKFSIAMKNCNIVFWRAYGNHEKCYEDGKNHMETLTVYIFRSVLIVRATSSYFCQNSLVLHIVESCYCKVKLCEASLRHMHKLLVDNSVDILEPTIKQKEIYKEHHQTIYHTKIRPFECARNNLILNL